MTGHEYAACSRTRRNEMPLIHVPRPPKNSFDPARPVSALLKAQVEYLEAAELKLPARYQSEIYANAIKTEGEAADYVRRVTEAIHDAHDEAAARRRRPVTKRKRGLEIAAVADERPRRKTKMKTTRKAARKK
jgi:hypothetical protein